MKSLCNIILMKMADPKYANLFGIAYDQPDVYETDDLPESEQNIDYYEEESESIERLHISATDAFSKFEGKSLNAQNVDFSDCISKRNARGYDARSGEWVLAGEGEKETPVQKYQRLKCEMEELLQEISALKGVAKDETTKEGAPYTAVAAQLESMQKHLSSLKLEDTLGSELVGSLTDPQGALLKKLLSQMTQLQVGGGGESRPSGGSGEPIIRYQLTVKPGHMQIAQISRIADLEQRISKMESIVGATPPKLSRLGVGDQSLLETAQWLSSRVSLLDPVQLETADVRVSALTQKLDLIAEKTASITSSQDPDRDKKISELYDLAKKVEKMSQMVPKVVERLVALQDLHKKGCEFTKTFTELESLQTQLLAKARGNTDLLQNVEESLKTDLAKVTANMEHLDARIKALNEKK